jgi:hypothetical protein
MTTAPAILAILVVAASATSAIPLAQATTPVHAILLLAILVEGVAIVMIPPASVAEVVMILTLIVLSRMQ